VEAKGSSQTQQQQHQQQQAYAQGDEEEKTVVEKKKKRHSNSSPIPDKNHYLLPPLEFKGPRKTLVRDLDGACISVFVCLLALLALLARFGLPPFALTSHADVLILSLF
jgi:hypothetical protein